jgi:hypothetical protein
MDKIPNVNTAAEVEAMRQNNPQGLNPQPEEPGLTMASVEGKTLKNNKSDVKVISPNVQRNY